MALDLSQYTNVSDPRRRNAQSFQLGDLFVDQENIYSRGPEGERGDLERSINSYYRGGLGGQKLMRLDDLSPEAAGHYLNTGKAFDLNGMKFISEADALPVWKALGGGADGVNKAISDYAVPAAMALMTYGAGSGAGLGAEEFAGMGTFGQPSGFVGGGSGGGVSGATGGGEIAAGSSATSVPAGTTAAGTGAAGFGTLPDTTQWLNPTELTGQAGGLPTANAGQMGSVVDLSNSALNLPAASGVTGGYTPGLLETITNGVKSVAGSLTQPTGGSTAGIPNDVWKAIITTGGGWLAADAKSDALKDVTGQWLAMGQPSRDRFNASFAPGFDIMTADPALRPALDTAAETRARALSVGGNPAANPGMQAEIDKYLVGNIILPQLNTYRSQNLTGGQLGTNTAGTASLGGAQAAGGKYEAIGAGAGELFGTSLDDTLQAMKKYGMTPNFTLNTGQPKNGSLTLS